MSNARSEHNTTAKLILASASPRRREILEAAGIAFEVRPASVSERQKKGESPRHLVARLAKAKAAAARATLSASSGATILGADTVVVIGSHTLGKPRSARDARRMLRLLSGRQHKVLTGLCLLFPLQPDSKLKRRQIVRVASTTVKFARLTDREIEEYAATGEPLDKAGGYAIQGRASKFVEWIEGCYFNVVGLPVSLLYTMLKKSAWRR